LLDHSYITLLFRTSAGHAQGLSQAERVAGKVVRATARSVNAASFHFRPAHVRARRTIACVSSRQTSSSDISLFCPASTVTLHTLECSSFFCARSMTGEYLLSLATRTCFVYGPREYRARRSHALHDVYIRT